MLTLIFLFLICLFVYLFIYLYIKKVTGLASMHCRSYLMVLIYLIVFKGLKCHFPPKKGFQPRKYIGIFGYAMALSVTTSN